MRNVLELLHSRKNSKKKKQKNPQIFFHVDITKDNELQNLSLHHSFLTEMSQLANEN